MSREVFYVYMMTNKGQTTLYIGVTNSLVRRVHQHRSGDVSGFTERYNLNRLVYYEQSNDPRDARSLDKLGMTDVGGVGMTEVAVWDDRFCVSCRAQSRHLCLGGTTLAAPL